MQYTRPDYYDDFSCIAGDCPDTCCAGWQIVIDEDSLEKYRTQKGPFGNRLHDDIDWEEGVFHQYKGDCCFLNDEKLCDIYAELGEEHLCYTCRTYPRYTEEFEGLREQFLCISCPVVAEMLLGRKSKTVLCTTELEEEEEEDYEDFDFFLFDKLDASRNYLLEMLQDRQKKLSHRQAILLSFGHDMQRRVRRQEIFAMDDLLERYQKEKTWKFFAKKEEEYAQEQQARYFVAKAYIELLGSLEIRQEAWKRWLDRCQQVLYADGVTSYVEWRKRFWKEQRDREELQMELYIEQITVYYLLHYYCGAVYDENIFAKVKLAMLSGIIIEEMVFARWILCQEDIKKSDWVALTYQYAREIEHSDCNIETLENKLSKMLEFRTKNLIQSVYH